jgi:NAD(P)-dependent dehydrogenase (short-subunit alcohol dehydrogenase family)
MGKGFGLSERRVVLTGAGGSIGRALIEAFLAEGAQVTACDAAWDDGQVPSGVRSITFDLRDAVAVERAAGDILTEGAPDIVVSNAGWTRADRFDDLGPGMIQAEMDVNFTGAALLTDRLRAAMRAGARTRGGAAFVFVLSVNGLSHFGNPPYSAAKAALGAWSRAIAVEEGAHAIRSNAVVPASVRTHAWDYRLETDPGVLDRVSALYPLGRLVEVEEVVNAVLFLASPLSSGITGTELRVDGGVLAGNLSFLSAIAPREAHR